MIEQDFEKFARSISERNQQGRADLQRQAARLSSILASNDNEGLEAFNDELADTLRGLLEGTGEDPAAGGTDGSATHGGDSSGQPAEH